LTHVVVTGAGFGALRAVRELRRADRTLEITLIAPQPIFTYYPSLIWVPSGYRRPEELSVDVREFLQRMDADHLQARVTGVRDAGRTVDTDRGPVGNDGLILANGGRFLRRIPGIDNVVTLCQGGRSAQEIGRRLAELDGGRIALGFAGNPQHRPAMRGGPMFELAFCLDNQLRREGRRARFELTFFSPNPRPGQRLGDRAVAGLMRRLDRQDIRTHLGYRIQRFEPGRVVTDGGSVESDLTVFMPGMTGPDWLADSDLPVTESGHIEVDERARVPGLAHVWAVGDCAAFPGPSWQAKQAHAADVQASVAARNLSAELRGRAADRSVRHEIVCILDSLRDGVLVVRTDRRQVVLPPLRLAHWGKIALEKLFLWKYGPRQVRRRLLTGRSAYGGGGDTATAA
jgi:sulfide:quinone oxidoreductase